MKGPRKRGAISVVISLILAGAIPPLSHAADDQDKINQARKSYYSLKTAGFAEFRAKVQPDWESMLISLKADDATKDKILPILKKTQFEVVVGPDGASTVSHQIDAAPPDEDIANRTRGITQAIEQILTGFFQTWSGFTITSLFPDPGEKFQLEGQAEKYHLTYGDGTSDVSIVMAHDFAMEEMKVTTAQFEATIQPQWARNDSGFLLSGYIASYKMASGDVQQASVSIDYSDVEQLKLPRTVKANLPTPAGQMEVILAFSDYLVKKN